MTMTTMMMMMVTTTTMIWKSSVTYLAQFPQWLHSMKQERDMLQYIDISTIPVLIYISEFNYFLISILISMCVGYVVYNF